MFHPNDEAVAAEKKGIEQDSLTPSFTPLSPLHAGTSSVIYIRVRMWRGLMNV